MLIQDRVEALLFRARPDPTSSDGEGRILARFVVYQEISDAEMKKWMTLTPKGSQGVAVNLFMVPIQPLLETEVVDGEYQEMTDNDVAPPEGVEPTDAGLHHVLPVGG